MLREWLTVWENGGARGCRLACPRGAFGMNGCQEPFFIGTVRLIMFHQEMRCADG